jgi:DNA-binding MarR family transcriptional regulator
MNRDKLLKSLQSEKQPFGVIPKRIMTTQVLTPFQKLFYAWLLSNDPLFNPSLRFIAKELSVSLQTVFKARNKLVECNLIRVISRGRRSAVYHFIDPRYWKI